MDLKDEQWAVVEPLLPKAPRRADGKGRPRVDDRAILNGILWVYAGWFARIHPQDRPGSLDHSRRGCLGFRKFFKYFTVFVTQGS
jgi:transposase